MARCSSCGVLDCVTLRLVWLHVVLCRPAYLSLKWRTTGMLPSPPPYIPRTRRVSCLLFPSTTVSSVADNLQGPRRGEAHLRMSSWCHETFADAGWAVGIRGCHSLCCQPRGHGPCRCFSWTDRSTHFQRLVCRSVGRVLQ